MQFSNVDLVYFSATGTTKKIIDSIGRATDVRKTDYNLLNRALKEETTIPSDHLAVVGMPVYNGRIPTIGASNLKLLKGKRTPVIAAVVYGNREYEDALLELKDILEKNGFIVIGAAAFIARHSIFPQVAADRPDANDIAKAQEFAKQCFEKLQNASSIRALPPLKVKGNFPYRKASGVPMKPISNGDCDLCGSCAQICPMHAITMTPTATVTNNLLCISCGACIDVCPIEAREYSGAEYEAFRSKFVPRYSAPKEIEIFI